MTATEYLRDLNQRIDRLDIDIRFGKYMNEYRESVLALDASKPIAWATGTLELYQRLESARSQFENAIRRREQLQTEQLALWDMTDEEKAAHVAQAIV